LTFDPASRAVRTELAASHRQIGHFFRNQGDHDAALARYQEALQLEQELVRLDPSVIIYQNNLAKCYFDMGTVYDRLKQWDKGREVFAAAAAIRRKIVDGNPEHLAYKSDLAITLLNLGVCEWNLGREEEGLRHVLQARKERRWILDRAPEMLDNRKRLSSTCRTLLEWHRKRGQWDQALERSLERRGFWPKDAAMLFDISRELGRSALLLKGKKDPALLKLRERFLTEAVTTASQAIAAGWADTARLTKEPDFADLLGRDDFQKLLKK
jgi:tetratricopeptide (TPR) repeat protein